MGTLANEGGEVLVTLAMSESGLKKIGAFYRFELAR